MLWQPITNKLTLQTADVILLCTKKPVPNSGLSYPYSIAYVVYPKILSKPEAPVNCSQHAYFLWWMSFQLHTQPPGWKCTPFRLSTIAYSISSQLPSIAVPLSVIHGHPMLWWQMIHLIWPHLRYPKKKVFTHPKSTLIIHYYWADIVHLLNQKFVAYTSQIKHILTIKVAQK
jgi:hypothetical protein